MHFKPQEIYKYKLRFIDILRQKSRDVLDGKGSLVCINQDHETPDRKHVVVSVIVSLTNINSDMKTVGCNKFTYVHLGSGIMSLSDF